MERISAEMAKIHAHEEICTLRHNIINARLKRIEGGVITGVLSTLGLMITIVLKAKGIL